MIKKEMKSYFYYDVPCHGRVERVDYETVNAAGEKVKKYANVYLPYEYYKTDEKYNITYMMHGGGGNPDSFLDASASKNMLDIMFDKKLAKPSIVVFPSYYNEEQPNRSDRGSDFEGNRTLFFQKEFVRDLIPAVESKYRTYAENVTEDGIRASRGHRAFGGFSMGACTTWYAFTKNLAYVSRFIPLSGDCWEITMKGGESETEKTVSVIIDSIKKQGFSKEDYKIFAATGDKDIAYPALTPQMEGLSCEKDYFEYSDDYSQGNLHYLVVSDKYHSYDTVMLYWQDFLPYIFD